MSGYECVLCLGDCPVNSAGVCRKCALVAAAELVFLQRLERSLRRTLAEDDAEEFADVEG